MPPLTEIRCPRGDAAPEGSSRALWRQRSAPQGHPVPSPHPQLSLRSQAMSRGHPPATTDGETEAEEGPGPRSQSRRHPCGLIPGTELPRCRHHAHHSPNSSACNPTPKSHAQRGGSFPSTATLPRPAKPGTSLPVVQPLQHRWVPQPCPLPQGCSLGGEARDAGDASSGEGGATDNPWPQRGGVWGSQHP